MARTNQTAAARESTQTATGAITKKPDKETTFRHFQHIVYVIVGPEKQKFGMHKDHLCATSPYFKAALAGKFQEADLGEVILKDTSTKAFEAFNEWLYTGDITKGVCKEKTLSCSQQESEDKPSFNQLLDVWLLADYLLVPRLQNYVVDMIIAKQVSENRIPTYAFAYFYENTHLGSLMRKLMVDIFAWKWGGGSSKYRNYAEQIPFEMNMDLLIAFARQLSKEDENPFNIPGRYHVPVKD